ncbi:43613_t:CDS:2 [Gigaspora margarita]|uniref:43613_t:CDS:1 n=1 Tax=Gigaspora margarita TaxID=4874 RepID=A0ABM8W152_GIGMA|nr:43613_t:CDS:2 [Gigaspora margarita]
MFKHKMKIKSPLERNSDQKPFPEISMAAQIDLKKCVKLDVK